MNFIYLFQAVPLNLLKSCPLYPGLGWLSAVFGKLPLVWAKWSQTMYGSRLAHLFVEIGAHCIVGKGERGLPQSLRFVPFLQI